MLRNKIGEFRRNHAKGGISKAHLARQIGVTRSYMSKIECGSQCPSLELAFRMAQYFNCEIEDLFLYN